jgi:hypothetical protein
MAPVPTGGAEISIYDTDSQTVVGDVDTETDGGPDTNWGKKAPMLDGEGVAAKPGQPYPMSVPRKG